VAVIATPGSTAAAIAAKAATTTIPIIFSGGGNPVQTGLVASLNRPGGNVTGISSMNVELGAKRLGLLHELVPSAARFFVLINPKNPFAEAFVTDVRTAAMGRQIEVVSASTNLDIDTAFAILVLEPTHSWSVQTRCSSAAACNSPRWRRATRCPQSTPSVKMSKPAG
jgi:putative tryptophan/tyrosine transport system substrate-binding protein